MSNPLSDKSFDETCSDSSEENRIPIAYFKPNQLQLVLNGFIYNRVGKEKNKD